MSFIIDAETILSADEFSRLQSLQASASAFEATAKEEEELFGLKTKVHSEVSDRERLKALEVLSNKTFSCFDVLKTGGYTRKEVMVAVGLLFKPTVVENSAPIASYATGIGSGLMHFSQGERMTKELKTAIHDGGIATFVANLTDFGKTYLSEQKVLAKGARSGTSVHQNLIDVAKRLGFDVAQLQAAFPI